MLSLAWVAAAAAGPTDLTEKPERWQWPEDPVLRQSLASIERGLARQDLSILARLFPYDEKVLVRWDRPVRQDGPLTGSQVVLLLRDLFRQYRSEQFSLQPGALLGPGSLYHCMGRWTLRSSTGQSQSIELHFSLKQDLGVWTIRELRQTR